MQHFCPLFYSFEFTQVPISFSVRFACLLFSNGIQTPGASITGIFFPFMSAAAILIVIEQIIERHPRDFVWPLFFEDFHILGVVSVLFVFTAALTDLISSRYEKGSTN